MNSLPKRWRAPRPGALLSRTDLSGPRTRASAAQQLKVAGSGCVVCGRAPVDPAHLVPQRLGGCRHPDCVIALCRTHHRLFDRARLALAPYLGDDFDRELAHALIHVEASELQLALTGRGWPAPWTEETTKRRSER